MQFPPHRGWSKPGALCVWFTSEGSEFSSHIRKRCRVINLSPLWGLRGTKCENTLNVHASPSTYLQNTKMCFFLCLCFPSRTHDRLQEKAADTIESLHKAGMKVWVLTGDKMETAAATCYASKLFHRNTQILELTTKRTEEQSLHDVLFDLSRTVLRQHGGMTRDTFSGCVCVFVRDSHRLLACQPWRGLLRFYVTPGLSNICTYWTIRKLLYRLVFERFFVCPVYQVTALIMV